MGSPAIQSYFSRSQIFARKYQYIQKRGKKGENSVGSEPCECSAIFSFFTRSACLFVGVLFAFPMSTARIPTTAVRSSVRFYQEMHFCCCSVLFFLFCRKKIIFLCATGMCAGIICNDRTLTFTNASASAFECGTIQCERARVCVCLRLPNVLPKVYIHIKWHPERHKWLIKGLWRVSQAAVWWK